MIGYNLTFSRTNFIVIIFFIFLILIKDKYILKIQKLLYLELAISLIITFVVPIFFYNERINKLLSTRLYLFRNYMLKYNFSWLGDRDIAKNYLNIPLDNLYLRIFIEHGILGIIIFIFLIIIVIKKMYQFKDAKAIRILISIILFSIFESTGFQYYFNILFLIVPKYICLKNNKSLK